MSNHQLPFALLFAALTCARGADASPSSIELVRQGAAHEQAGELDVAIRRYTDAISLDRATTPAYVALARIRSRLGDYTEAARIYSLLLEYDPGSLVAIRERAHARFLGGDHALAEEELEAALEPSWDATTARELAAEYQADALYPAALSIWRQLLSHTTGASPTGDDPTPPLASTMVQAFMRLVDADPVAHPASRSWARRSLSLIARESPARQPWAAGSRATNAE